jgi:hypothetical protein
LRLDSKRPSKSIKRTPKSSPDKATAKLGLKMIPSVIIVREDDAAKTITFKAGPDAEEMTMHYEGRQFKGTVQAPRHQ